MTYFIVRYIFIVIYLLYYLHKKIKSDKWSNMNYIYLWDGGSKETQTSLGNTTSLQFSSKRSLHKFSLFDLS